MWHMMPGGFSINKKKVRISLSFDLTKWVVMFLLCLVRFAFALYDPRKFVSIYAGGSLRTNMYCYRATIDYL